MKKIPEFNGLAAALTIDGDTIYYCYNANKINIEQFLYLEQLTQLNAMRNKYRLFKLYEIQNIKYIYMGLN
jgi:hypothetical protein